MKTTLDCIPCLFRQALETARIFSKDEAVHERLLKDVLNWCRDMDMAKPAPVMGQRIHRRLREITGLKDPYRRAKNAQNKMALSLLPGLRRELARSGDRLELAARMAIAGNIIDMGAYGDIGVKGVRKAVRHALAEPLRGEMPSFRLAAKKARSILYLADNAGEIVFDRLLIEELFPQRVTVVVRGHPVLNDAVMADARAAGLHKLARVIDNGSDAPGTVLEETSPEFKALFKTADLVIAKGQGNYETLSEAPRRVYFLFKAKCPVIAGRAGVALGEQVLARSGHG